MEFETLLSDFTRRDWQTFEQADPVRFAMIGLGWWTREEAIPAVTESDFCKVTVAVSGSKEKAVDVANGHATIEHGMTYEEFHAGEATDAYDAVYVCTPNATHPEFVARAAELDKHVLCEKPMAASTEGAERMIEQCEGADVTLMIAYRLQTEPAIRRAREMINTGIIGDPIQVHSHMSDSVPDLIPDPDQWRLDPELSGGATLIDIGLYPLNTTRFLLDRDPVGVYADIVANHPWFEGQDEHVSFQVEFQDDITAVCAVSHNAFEASHLKVVGDAGEITIEPVFFPWKDRRLVVRQAGAKVTFEFEQINQMLEEFDYFAHCLHTDTEPHPDGRHGLVDLQAIEAMYDSAERNERIQL